MKKCIGVDLGGTNLRAGVVDPVSGEISHLTSVPTHAAEGHDAVMRRMGELVNNVIHVSGRSPTEFAAIGIGVPGMLDLERGTTLFLPNLPGNWRNVPLAATIQSLTGLPVALLNDVRAITYGEWKFGAGRGAETVAVFAIGTGIGGGLVIHNRLHLGLGGTAGELGHMTIDFNGPRCGCGNHGCVEAFASGPAIAAMGMKAVAQGLTTTIGARVGYDLNQITPEVIAQAAEEGDAIAREIFDQAGMYLGVAIASIIVAVTPKRVIIAGGIARAGDLLLEPIRRTVQQRVTLAPVEQIQIIPAALGDKAGVAGVALWAGEGGGMKEKG